MNKQLPKIKAILTVIALCFSINILSTNTNDGVDNATLVNSFPFTDNDINYLQGWLNNTMAEPCEFTSIFTLVYKVVTPSYGSLRAYMTNFTETSECIIAYTSPTEDPTTEADFILYTSDGNLCSVRDTMQLGSGYIWSNEVTKGTSSDEYTTELGWIDGAVKETDALAPGTYFVFVSNYSGDFGDADHTSDLTFEFAAFPECPSGSICATQTISLCDGEGYTSPEGNLYTESGSYTDILTGAAEGGLDSVIYTNLTISHSEYLQDELSDVTICENSELNFTATTEYVNYANFDGANSQYISLNNIVPSLAGLNRSVFLWVKKTVESSASEILVGINETGDDYNVSHFRISSTGYLSIYDGEAYKNSSFVMDDGEWHHVGYTYDSSTYETKIYADGELIKSFYDYQSFTSNDYITLGMEYDGNASSAGDYFTGQMTEITFWNEILDTDDIALIMNATVAESHPKYENLIAYYSTNLSCDASTLELVDISGNGFDATASDDNILSTENIENISGFNAITYYNYYWLQDGSNHTSNADISITGNLSEAGDYTLEIYRDYITVYDDWTLNINETPVITQQPNDVIANEGSDATFEVETSAGTYEYQWKNNETSFTTLTTDSGLADDYCNNIKEHDGILYVATNGGLSISTDGGASFINKTSSDGLGSDDCSHVFVNDNAIYASTGSGLSISTDGGESFETKTTSNGLITDNIKITFEYNDVIYACCLGDDVFTSTTICTSTDGGTSFTAVEYSSGINSHVINGYCEINGTVYLATPRFVSYTNDNGASFSNISTTNGLISNYTIDVYETDGIIYVSNSGGLSISSDGGTSFINKESEDGLTSSYCSKVYSSNGVLYIASNNGLYISTDGGESFTNKTTDDGLANSLCLDVIKYNETIFVATASGLSVSQDYSVINGENDASMTLADITSSMDNNTYYVEITNTTTGCAIESEEATLSISTSTDISSSLLSSISLYPNPTAGQITINMPETYNTALVSLSDLSGKLLYTQTFYGDSSIKLDIDQPTGLYFIVVNIDGDSQVFKVTKK
jgi:hypothetical protein